MIRELLSCLLLELPNFFEISLLDTGFFYGTLYLDNTLARKVLGLYDTVPVKGMYKMLKPSDEYG